VISRKHSGAWVIGLACHADPLAEDGEGVQDFLHDGEVAPLRTAHRRSQVHASRRLTIEATILL